MGCQFYKTAISPKLLVIAQVSFLRWLRFAGWLLWDGPIKAPCDPHHPSPSTMDKAPIPSLDMNKLT